MRFEPTELTESEQALRNEVREFLARELPRGSFRPALGMVGEKDAELSQKLGARGWLGMALPDEYGGGDRSAVERFVVVEELLRWGAPVDHHWTADRQSGPIIAKYGTEEQKRRFLPAICRGEVSFSIGMSEPDAGSDLAAVRTRATKVDGGWLLNGTKIWTSGAHENDWFIVLCRTSDEEDRHDGLSRFLVDLRSPGISVHPITFLDGSHEFNEVVLSDVFVPDDMLLGAVGEGWSQNVSELVYERGGPERWLSVYLMLEEFVRERTEQLDDAALEALGELTARLWAIRKMSLAVARMIDEGRAPAVESALVKHLGTAFEQDVVAELGKLADLEPSPQSPSAFEQLLVRTTLTSPSFTIRGGTSEILRSVITKGLGR